MTHSYAWYSDFVVYYKTCPCQYGPTASRTSKRSTSSIHTNYTSNWFYSLPHTVRLALNDHGCQSSVSQHKYFESASLVVVRGRHVLPICCAARGPLPWGRWHINWLPKGNMIRQIRLLLKRHERGVIIGTIRNNRHVGERLLIRHRITADVGYIVNQTRQLSKYWRYYVVDLCYLEAVVLFVMMKTYSFWWVLLIVMKLYSV